MNNWFNNLIDNSVQCWGCPVFDRLFQIVSDAAAAVYEQFAFFCVVLFCVMFAFYILNAVWQNIKGGIKDPMYEKSVQKVFLNAVVAMAFLVMGVALPRFMTMITFEPTAQITLIYTQSMLQTDNDTVNEKVTYQPQPMKDNGFYRPQLRNTIIMLMKTTITQFQSYMKLGIAVMDNALSWKALLGIGSLFKHIIMLFVGLFITIGFFKLFVNFCFYFIDIIVAMTFFAFFFPLSLVMVSFNGADDVPKWMSGFGKSLGTGQFKKMINAIISLAAAVLTYTVIMMIIARFFSEPDATVNELMQKIIAGDVFEADLSDDNLATLTLGSCIVLIFVLNFIRDQIPQVTKMVLSAFNVSEEHKLADDVYNDTMRLTTVVVEKAKEIGKTIISGGDAKDDKKGAGKK